MIQTFDIKVVVYCAATSVNGMYTESTAQSISDRITVYKIMLDIYKNTYMYVTKNIFLMLCMSVKHASWVPATLRGVFRKISFFLPFQCDWAITLTWLMAASSS